MLETILQTFQLFPWWFYLVCGLLGLAIGSFLNVVIFRLPVMLEHGWRKECRELLGVDDIPEQASSRFSLAWPGSHCPICKHPISPLENIPVVSYFWLRGRCAHCGTSISLRYPFIELFCAVFTLIAAWKFGPSASLIPVLLFTWALLALAMIDYDTQLLPDDITLPLLWLGLFCNVWGLFTDLSSAVMGAIVGYLSLWSVYHAFKLLTGKEGMGYGDFKLLAAFGAWMGWEALPLIILVSSLAGAVIGTLLLILKQQGRDTPIPFGPFLAVAGWTTLVWQSEFMSAYYAWMGFL